MSQQPKTVIDENDAIDDSSPRNLESAMARHYLADLWDGWLIMAFYRFRKSPSTYEPPRVVDGSSGQQVYRMRVRK
jgi:hypothetical protein